MFIPKSTSFLFDRKFVAELSGTFTLVFFGCGAIIINDLFGGKITHIGISLIFGLIVMIMIYSLGNVSGCHINPAVTAAFFIAKQISFLRLISYVSAQFIGGMLAITLLLLLFPTHPTMGATLPKGGTFVSFIIELTLSFILMFVIFNVSSGYKNTGIISALAVGGTIACEAMLAGAVSGGSMNPIRSLAPAIVSGHLATIWIYLTAPVAGCIIAYPLVKYIQNENFAKTS